MKSRKTIQDCLKERILVIDGAMGTMIQRHKLEEADYRGDRRRTAWCCNRYRLREIRYGMRGIHGCRRRATASS